MEDTRGVRGWGLGSRTCYEPSQAGVQTPQTAGETAHLAGSLLELSAMKAARCNRSHCGPLFGDKQVPIHFFFPLP